MPNSIKGVEIFRTGVHNGDTYTAADLNDMVTAHSALDFRPAIKVGHTKDAPGAPSYGWVQNLRVDGEKLLADFTDMHDSVLDSIRKKSYDRVSSEIYFNLKRGGKQHRRALKAVALLGAEVPAVANLTPLHKMEFAAAGEYETCPAFEQALDVPSTAIVDALAEQVARLSLQVTELAKSKKVETKTLKKEPRIMKFKLKEYQAQLKKYTEQLSSEDEAVVAEAKTKLVELNAAEIEPEVPAADPAVAELTRQLAAEKAAREAGDARVAALAAKDRSNQVTAILGTLTIPAFRPMLQAFATYAVENEGTKVKVYSTDKDGKVLAEEKSLVEVTTGLIAAINDQGKKVFKVFDDRSGERVRADRAAEDDPEAEVSKLTDEWLAKNPGKQYSDAIQAVRAANPEIFKQYSEQQGSRRAN